MTTVTLNGMNAALGAPEPIENGTVEATYWAGGAPATRVTGANVVLPATMRSAIVAGAPSTALVVDATDGTFCVRWRVQSRGHVYERFTSIPVSASPVAFGDLPVVDPNTYLPLDPQPPSVQEILDEAASIASASVMFRNHDGSVVAAPKVVVVTLTADGQDIDDIAVYDSIDEVGA